MAETLVKQPAESRLYNFDFASVDSSVTLSTAVSVTQANQGRVLASSDLTIGASALSGSQLQVRISGGTDGELYLLTARATDTNGNTLEMEGWLSVEDLS